MKIQQFDSIFRKLYGQDDGALKKQDLRYSELAGLYRERFGEGTLHFFSTPGRTEIGGNHTDHNHGRVLAASINLDSIAVASPNDSDRVIAYSEGYAEPFEVDLIDLQVKKREEESTNSLIRGIAARMKDMGHNIGGFNACISSDVLPGSGLSSSASIEVLIGTIFNSFFNNNSIGPETIALIGQFAENHYFGKPCGLMDQTACAVGGIITIDFKDPGAPLINKVDFDFDAQDYKLIVVDTGGTHADLTDDYASVPDEMKSVAQYFGRTVCRDLSMEDLLREIKELRRETGDRALLRAIHFIGDNERVTKQVEALENNDFMHFLKLVNESGNSSYKRLQNIYSPNNISEQGVSLALTLTEDYLCKVKEGACRVHGGGFAGTIQVFLPSRAVKGYRELMEKVFGKDSVHVLRIRPLGSLHVGSV